MLSFRGPGTLLCDGISRRDFLTVGSLSTLGLTLPGLFRAEPAFASQSQIANRKSQVNVLLLWLWGAPSHIDTWDMKPDAPAEIRGPWQPIRSSAPGIDIVEHLPQFAKWAHKLTFVRSMSNDAPDHPEGAAVALSGFKFNPKVPDKEGPFLGSVISKFAHSPSVMPPYVTLGKVIFDNGKVVPGQTGGFLGGGYAPYRIEDPRDGVEKLPALQLPEGMTPERFDRRLMVNRMLDQFQRHAEGVKSYDVAYERAVRMLTAPETKRAFDLSLEPERLRDRYGRHFFGQSCLMARRLVEAGTRFVQVNWSRHPGADGLEGWDVHGNFGGFLTDYEHKQFPIFDQAASALIEDMEQRGLFKNTLLILATEFGRAPQINKFGGRDHWPNVYTNMFAGAGIEGGRVIGASDETGAYPITKPMLPSNFLATVYEMMGLDLIELRKVGLLSEAEGIPGLVGNGG